MSIAFQRHATVDAVAQPVKADAPEPGMQRPLRHMQTHQRHAISDQPFTIPDQKLFARSSIKPPGDQPGCQFGDRGKAEISIGHQRSLRVTVRNFNNI
ncbi:hypothetical protein GCM10010961_37530 [Pseudodonghicola xiamenensis]|uniref:Uncharacterized protein n=1 Tax=Pseudodonghicola xiamenensis TaxID=337702 RepID=A0A8J3HBR2_9RHOB|nr:hypothetical protein GCM10010961_37530 [Pseudodonghicola xiamenensis]